MTKLNTHEQNVFNNFKVCADAAADDLHETIDDFLSECRVAAFAKTNFYADKASKANPNVRRNKLVQELMSSAALQTAIRDYVDAKKPNVKVVRPIK